MNKIVILDSLEMLAESGIDVSAMPVDEQLANIFRLAEEGLREEGLTMNNVIMTSNEVADMGDRPALDEAQKKVWTDPKYYPCRVTVQRGGFKAGAKIRCVFTALKVDHTPINADPRLKPNSPFSCAVLAGKRVYCSGARPLNPETRVRVSDDAKECAVQCLKILELNLQVAGTDLKKADSFLIFVPELTHISEILSAFEELGLSEKQAKFQIELVDAINGGDPVEIACNAVV